MPGGVISAFPARRVLRARVERPSGPKATGRRQTNVRTGLANYLARGNSANASTIASVLASIDGAVGLSFPTLPWAQYNAATAVPYVNAYSSVVGLTPGNPDLNLWRNLLGFQAIVYLWAESGLQPRDPISVSPPVPSYHSFLRDFVADKREFRAFTSQASALSEGDVVLEHFMRRIQKPYGF